MRLILVLLLLIATWTNPIYAQDGTADTFKSIDASSFEGEPAVFKSMNLSGVSAEGEPLSVTIFAVSEHADKIVVQNGSNIVSIDIELDFRDVERYWEGIVVRSISNKTLMISIPYPGSRSTCYDIQNHKSPYIYIYIGGGGSVTASMEVQDKCAVIGKEMKVLQVAPNRFRISGSS